nr:membrane protein FxsA [Candidatus Omnitrophota bacterium]
MFGYLLLLFTLVPLIELALLIQIGQYIGTLNTVLLVIVTGVCGAYLARAQGFILIRDIRRELDQGIMPAERMLEGVIVLASGVVLLTPGILTDILGFLGLIPVTRQVLKRWLKYRFRGMLEKRQDARFTGFREF